jgi:Coenzyme PQQ synthesis protein D (PqqD)
MLLLTQKVSVKKDILVQEMGAELVLLNLASEEYFGLDDIGNIMWNYLAESGSLQVTYDRLLEKYDADPTELKQDFLNLVERFIEHDLVEIADS